jgi:hypothetical protein
LSIWQKIALFTSKTGDTGPTIHFGGPISPPFLALSSLEGKASMGIKTSRPGFPGTGGFSFEAMDHRFHLNFVNIKPEQTGSLKVGIAERQNQYDYESAGEKYEYAKTLDDVLRCESAIQLVNDALKNLGGDKTEFSIGKIHFFKEEGYREIFGEDSSPAFSTPEYDNICINKDFTRDDKMLAFYILVHELFHTFTVSKLVVRPDESGKFQVLATKTGYGIHNSADGQPHFRGLNEAMTQKLTKEVIRDHKKEIVKLLKIKDYEFAKFEKNNVNEYDTYIELVDYLIDQISKNTHLPKEQVELKFKQEYFAGNVLFLRIVEQIYGKGALRILAFMGEHEPRDFWPYTKMIHNWFSSNSQQERDEIARKILPVAEFAKYQVVTD